VGDPPGTEVIEPVPALLVDRLGGLVGGDDHPALVLAQAHGQQRGAAAGGGLEGRSRLRCEFLGAHVGIDGGTGGGCGVRPPVRKRLQRMRVALQSDGGVQRR
jgi:hypothetical protein